MTGVAVDNIVIQNVIATAGTTTPSPLVPLVALPAANLGNTIPNASSSRSGDDGELGSTGTLRAESTFGPPFSDAGKITASQTLVGWLALDAVDLMFRDSSVAWWDGISEPF